VAKHSKCSNIPLWGNYSCLHTCSFLTKLLPSPPAKNISERFPLAIHSGGGTILKNQVIPEKEKRYTDDLNLALQTGYDILQKGGTALDAVEALVRSMEDNPLFNAGKGGCIHQ